MVHSQQYPVAVIKVSCVGKYKEHTPVVLGMQTHGRHGHHKVVMYAVELGLIVQLTLKAPITTAADDIFYNTFPKF